MHYQLQGGSAVTDCYCANGCVVVLCIMVQPRRGTNGMEGYGMVADAMNERSGWPHSRASLSSSYSYIHTCIHTVDIKSQSIERSNCIQCIPYIHHPLLHHPPRCHVPSSQPSPHLPIYPLVDFSPSAPLPHAAMPGTEHLQWSHDARESIPGESLHKTSPFNRRRTGLTTAQPQVPLAGKTTPTTLLLPQMLSYSCFPLLVSYASCSAIAHGRIYHLPHPFSRGCGRSLLAWAWRQGRQNGSSESPQLASSWLPYRWSYIVSKVQE